MKYLRHKAFPYVLAAVLATLYLMLKRSSEEGGRMLLDVLLILFGSVSAVRDLLDRRVPNKWPLAMLLAWVVVMIPQLFFNTEAAITRLLGGVLGFALCGVLLLLVYLISRRGLGGADVKFMAAAGLYLGWSYSLAVLLIGSVLAALVCGVLILLKKLGSRDSVPLIPFLFVGILFSLYSR